MATLAEIRARAAAHDEEIAALKWFTASDLAQRWKLAVSTVHAIPIEELRYKAFGRGTMKRRRYREDWVRSYEEATGLAPDEETAASV